MSVPKMIHNSVESFAQNRLIPESWTVLFPETVAFQNIFYQNAEKNSIMKKPFDFLKFLIHMWKSKITFHKTLQSLQLYIYIYIYV